MTVMQYGHPFSVTAAEWSAQRLLCGPAVLTIRVRSGTFMMPMSAVRRRFRGISTSMVTACPALTYVRKCSRELTRRSTPDGEGLASLMGMVN